MEPDSNQPIVTMKPESQPVEAEVSPDAAAVEADLKQAIRWEAAEQVDPYRPPIWYLFFVITVVALLAGAIFLLKSVIAALLVIVMAAALLVYLRRPPQQISYALGRKGLHINDKLYGFGEFRGFGVSVSQGNNTLILVPVKRFRPAVEAFFPDEIGESVVDALGSRLPMREVKLDTLDKIAHKLRF